MWVRVLLYVYGKMTKFSAKVGAHCQLSVTACFFVVDCGQISCRQERLSRHKKDVLWPVRDSTDNRNRIALLRTPIVWNQFFALNCQERKPRLFKLNVWTLGSYHKLSPLKTSSAVIETDLGFSIQFKKGVHVIEKKNLLWQQTFSHQRKLQNLKFGPTTTERLAIAQLEGGSLCWL